MQYIVYIIHYQIEIRCNNQLTFLRTEIQSKIKKLTFFFSHQIKNVKKQLKNFLIQLLMEKKSLDGITHDCNHSLTNQMTVTILFKDFSTKSLTYGAQRMKTQIKCFVNYFPLFIVNQSPNITQKQKILPQQLYHASQTSPSSLVSYQ